MAIIKSGDSGDLLKIDSSNAARTTLYDQLGNPAILKEDQNIASIAAGMLAMGKNDATAVPLRVDRFGSSATSFHNPILTESFEGSTIHAGRWLTSASGMAVSTTSSTGAILNSTNTLSANSYVSISSTRSIQVSQRQPIHIKFRANIIQNPNATSQVGMFNSVNNTANSTGFYFEFGTTGYVVPTFVFNGTNFNGDAILLTNTNYYTYDIFKDDDSIIYTIQDTLTGAVINKQTLALPTTAQRFLSATCLPFAARIFNSTTAPTIASKLTITDVYVSLLDGNLNAPLAHLMALQSKDSSQHPLTGAPTIQYTNNAEPTSATLSNTAAGYTTLGGKFQFAAVAGAVTDYALFSYVVPSPVNFVCTGVYIDTWVTGAAVATTPTLLQWSLITNATAISLANAYLTRTYIGSQSLAIGTPIGGMATTVNRQFDTPIVTGAGRYMTLALKMPVATATASSVIAGAVHFEGYFL